MDVAPASTKSNINDAEVALVLPTLLAAMAAKRLPALIFARHVECPLSLAKFLLTSSSSYCPLFLLPPSLPPSLPLSFYA